VATPLDDNRRPERHAFLYASERALPPAHARHVVSTFCDLLALRFGQSSLFIVLGVGGDEGSVGRANVVVSNVKRPIGSGTGLGASLAPCYAVREWSR
jgi:hypothetical protein